MRWFRFAILALTVPHIACGGGSSNSPAASAVSGNWQMNLQKSDSKLAPKNLSGFLAENADGTVTGNVLVSDIPCSGIGAVNGSVSQPNVSLVVSPNGLTVNLTGQIGTGSTSMSGNYTILSSGCGGSQSGPQSGSWTANQVSPFTGNISSGSTFTSRKFGATYPISGNVSQGQNNGSSYAPLTGNLSIKGSSCFSSATMSGLISGISVVLNFANASGTELGQISGTSSLDGTSLKGTYKVVPQNSPPGTPCREGDIGSVTLML
jgi:hypothetical protein